METLIAILMLVIVVLLIRAMHKQNQTLEALRKLDIQFRVRQGSIARQRTSQKNPTVDSHARTTKRDSNDLPLTGRMSQGVHRRKTNASNTDDTGLQPRTGLPPTSDR